MLIKATSLALTLDLIRLTGLNHEHIDIGPNNVASLRAPPAQRMGHFPASVHCVVYTTDGKFVPVLEDCDTVNKLLNHAKGD